MRSLLYECGHEVPQTFVLWCIACHHLRLITRTEEETNRISSLEAENAKLQARIEEIKSAEKEYLELTDNQLEDQAEEIDRLRDENAKLREGLKMAQYIDSSVCYQEEHEDIDDTIEHQLQCIGCWNHKCMGCKPDCWLSALLKEE